MSKILHDLSIRNTFFKNCLKKYHNHMAKFSQIKLIITTLDYNSMTTFSYYIEKIGRTVSTRKTLEKEHKIISACCLYHK